MAGQPAAGTRQSDLSAMDKVHNLYQLVFHWASEYAVL